VKFRPMKDKVLVRPIVTEGDRVSAGGIILAQTVRTSTEDATVVAVGPDVETIKVGDVVGYLPLTGVKVKIDETEYCIMREHEVCFVVE
jgi:chaperonin GroES